MIGNTLTTRPLQQALFNENNLTFTVTGYGFRARVIAESGLTLLPDGSVLSVDNNFGGGVNNPQTAERYVNGTSYPAGQTQQLFDTAQENGPQILLTDGTVLVVGANAGLASIYTPPSSAPPASLEPGSWANTTTLPATCGPGGTTQCAGPDIPGVLLPNGRVLILAGPVGSTNEFNPGVQFFEFDQTQSPPTWNQASYPGGLASQLKTDSPGGFTKLMLLPNGQVMYTNETSTIWMYTPAAGFSPSWQPTIQNWPSSINKNQTYTISGYLFNGMSQANFYGDDMQNATNYPLVQVTMNGSGHVYYGRTHNHSSMAVAQPSLLVTTEFELWDCNHQIAGSACIPPSPMERGMATLVVIANGIASAPVNVTIN